MLKTMDDVIRDLKLEPYGQDWGIICADVDRLAEFVDYAVQHGPDSDDVVRGNLLELVLSSAEEAVHAATYDSGVKDLVLKCLHACATPGPLVSLILPYWARYFSKLEAEIGFKPGLSEIVRTFAT